jgi:hypothetical protein
MYAPSPITYPIKEGEPFEGTGDVLAGQNTSPFSPSTGNGSFMNQRRSVSIAESYPESLISFDSQSLVDGLSMISSADGLSIYEGRRTSLTSKEKRRRGMKRGMNRNDDVYNELHSGKPSMSSFRSSTKSQESLAPSFMGAGAQFENVFVSRTMDRKTQKHMQRWRKAVTIVNATSAFSRGKRAMIAPRTYSPSLLSNSTVALHPNMAPSAAPPTSIQNFQQRGTNNYYCTICDSKDRKCYNKKFSWQRHETESHVRPEYWICNAEISPYSVEAIPRCPYTNIENPSREHLKKFFHDTCVEETLDKRVFFRKGHLEQHLKRHHQIPQPSITMAGTIRSWERKTTVDSYRKFLACPHDDCSELGSFETWEDRLNHVAGHFEGRYPAFPYDARHAPSFRAPTAVR